MRLLLPLVVGACAGAPPATPAPVPVPTPTPAPVPQPSPPNPETGPVELSLRISNQTGYDLVFLGIEFCGGGQCESDTFGDGTTVVLAAGTSVEDDTLIRDEEGNIVEMEYGDILQVGATAVDLDGYVYCMFGCEYSEYVVDDQISVFLDFTQADCCWEL